MSNFWLYSGIIAGITSIISFANHFTYSGSNLISAKNAKTLIKKGFIDTIIDIRTKLEYEFGHYPSAINIPVNGINKNTTKNISKDSNILVYCNTGQRARAAADKLNKLGFTKVVYIPGTYNTLFR